jgi:surface antigen
MRARGAGAGNLILYSFLALSTALTINTARANTPAKNSTQYGRTASTHAVSTSRLTVHVAMRGRLGLPNRPYQYARAGGISCVPFARSDSGIDVAGNAWQWWDNAAGVYARGSVPQPGSVLTFRANGRMHLGHVAVVARIINAREIEVDHANWWGPGIHGGVVHNMPVVDVSENNDWTAVRVGLGDTGSFGSVYPTYGFIYDRPDDGRILVATTAPAPQPDLNPAPRDLRPAADRGWEGIEEVAEVPLRPSKNYRHSYGTTYLAHRSTGGVTVAAAHHTTANVTLVAAHRTTANVTLVAHHTNGQATYYR